MTQNQAASVMAWFTFALIAIGGIIVWLVPVFVALSRRMPNRGQIIVVDLLLGWTLVGWIVALAMACGAKPRYPAVQQWGTPVGPPPGWQGPRR